MSRLTQGGTAKPVSRDQILGRERGQGNIYSLCSADHEQVWQSYPVDPYSDYFKEEGLSLLLMLSILHTFVYASSYVATLTAIYASLCRHLTVGSCCGSVWCNGTFNMPTLYQ